MLRITTLVSATLIGIGLMGSVAQAQESTASATAQAPIETQTQSETQSETQLGAQASANQFTDEQLQQFANAGQQASSLAQQYSQRLEQAEDETAKQAVRAEANDKLLEVVENSGLDIETFNAIGLAVQSDPELAQRVQQLAQP